MSFVIIPPKIDHWLPEAGQYYSPPDDTAPFDAAGSWNHAYVLLDNAPVRGGQRMATEGYVRIQRTQSQGNEPARLAVEQYSKKQYFGTCRVSFEIECSEDTLSTPESWAIESVSYDRKNKPVDVTRLHQTGSLAETRKFLASKDTPDVDGPISSNWTILDAVQRLGGKAIDPIEFAMLEDLDLYKPNQRLTYRGVAEFEFGDHKLTLSGYQQIGEGILPYHYWLDAAGRLIFAYGGLKGLMFHPNAVSLATKPANAPRAK